MGRSISRNTKYRALIRELKHFLGGDEAQIFFNLLKKKGVSQTEILRELRSNGIEYSRQNLAKRWGGVNEK